ncbi:putative RNA-dependent RNA polymerase 1 [Iris pallida]|uniref:RNA-dependent RNA polymerase n=1 Tax=Iris pallida TaxID=29817 RepID=A0AAX6G6Y1_IRIPA|nr:putative RNA-dependent RNA polymerase 1 [Iris pallida]
MGLRTIQVSGFPMNANANDAKDFLEKHAGQGSVFALKFRHPKRPKANSRAYVMVQFLTRTDAEKIINKAAHYLRYYDGSYLKVRDVERDIVPNPRRPMAVLEDTTLHCGCLILPSALSVLWSKTNVKVEFGFNLKRIHFILSCGARSYKLELSYESIWEIQLHHSSSKNSIFLLIWVQAAPRIYQMPLINSGLVHEYPLLDYFKDGSDDQWVRTIDFTPSHSIGQSSALCLELCHGCDLPNIRDNFVYYKEVEGFLKLQQGTPYSRSSELVPIIEPRRAFEIPYKILFKINHIVQNGMILMGPTLDDKFFNYVSPHLFPIAYIERALEHMSYLKSPCFDPAKWISQQYSKYRREKRHSHSPMITLENGLVYVHRVQVTPCKVYFYGPEINVSNRVLRHFSEDIDNFIRVSFVDEDGGKMRSTDLSPRSSGAADEKHTAVYSRILSTLRNGIVVGNKKFEFLAFSSSQLRENSTWMFSSRTGLTADGIRKWMGDFRKIRNVAKYAARLGQSLSSSTETLTVGRDEIEVIPDIESSFGHIFSDGIGKISLEFAKRVAIKCGLKSSVPSAFQIRYGGYKGVVAVDPTSSKKLSLRKSMSKFESENRKLDILAYSKYQPCFLNRQLITLLSTLGIKDDIFEMKQEEAVKELDEILTDPTRALDAIEMMHAGEITNVLKEMLLCGYRPDTEPFLSMLLQTFRASKLFELRTKSRIFVRKGRAMMGCLDETRTLEYGQVFIQISRTGSSGFHDNGFDEYGGSESDHNSYVVNGRVIVAKNPCLHPGDIRVLLAVDVPNLHHMIDCVVFPQKGKRPHPNECSGSDLDGDIYFVSWDQKLIPPREVLPMDYTAAQTETLSHDVTMEDVHEYFTNYIVNDSLGIISNAHTVFADRERLKAESEPCIELARLFSIAVDFPKTGVAAEIPQHLYAKEYPDFMEKLDKVTYESKGVIGKLFRAIKDDSVRAGRIRAFTKEVATKSYDPDMEVDGFEEYIDDAFFFKDQYDFKLGNLMDHYGIKTEAEILSGSVMQSKSYNKYKDGEALSFAVRSLRKEARGWFSENSSSSVQHEGGSNAKASAWYHVTYHPDYWGTYNSDLNRAHFLSFAWCVYDKLVLIKQKKLNMKKAAERAARLERRLRGLAIS